MSKPTFEEAQRITSRLYDEAFEAGRMYEHARRLDGRTRDGKAKREDYIVVMNHANDTQKDISALIAGGIFVDGKFVAEGSMTEDEAREEWEQDYREFVGRRADGMDISRFDAREELRDWHMYIEWKTGRVRVNTARVHLARASRGIKKGTAAKRLRLTTYLLGKWESPHEPLFLPPARVVDLVTVFHYPPRFFLTFDASREEEDSRLIKRQRAEWRAMTTGVFICRPTNYGEPKS